MSLLRRKSAACKSISSNTFLNLNSKSKVNANGNICLCTFLPSWCIYNQRKGQHEIKE